MAWPEAYPSGLPPAAGCPSRPRGSTMPQQHLDRLTSTDASFLHQEGPASHMHIGGGAGLRRPAAGVRRLPRSRPRAAAPRAALPAEAGDAAARDRTAAVGRRPDLQPRVPRPPHRAARARHRGAAVPPRRADRLPAARPLEAAVGELARRGARGRPLRADLQDPPLARRRRLGRRPRDRAVRPRADAGAAADRPRAVAAASPSRRRRRADRRRRRAALSTQPPSSSRARSARRHGPRRSFGSCAMPPRASARSCGPGSIRRPQTPLNVEIGPHRRFAVVRQRARRIQRGQERARRHGQRRRADGRLGSARALAALARRSAPRVSRCARSSRSPSAPRTSAARSATS